MTSSSHSEAYSLGRVDPLYAHMMSSEAIDAFKEADEMDSDSIRYNEPYLAQKAEERRYLALECMASAFGPSFSPNERRLHIH